MKKLQEEYYAVVPSEIGIKEPFKVGNDTIHITPYSYVKNELQRLSAYRGFDSDVVYSYCKGFLRFAQSTMPKDEWRLVEPFKQMLSRKKTVSDEILSYARKKGYKRGEQISSEIAAEIALYHSERLLKEIVTTKKILLNIA